MHHVQSRSAKATCIIIVILAAGVPAAGYAQVAETQVATPKSPDSTLAEITVTAQRRETKLQDTPVADTVIGGAAILEDRLTNLSDIAALAPSITFDQNNRAESFISIRGTTIGNDAAGIDQGVSVFIDDVPTTGFADNSPDLYDLQSVQVLRGPQGTLFGRNVTGGAVIIRTLPPSFEDAGRTTLTYGSYNLMNAQSYVTGPLRPDVLAGKLTLDVTHRDGYLRNITLNDKTGGLNMGSVRGQLLWAPSSSVNVLFGADYLADTSTDKIEWLAGNFVPSLYPGLSYSTDATNQGMNATSDRKIGGALVRVNWTNALGALTSVTGYRNVNTYLLYNSLGDPLNSVVANPRVQDQQLTEEIRLASPIEQRLSWVFGLFLMDSKRAYLQSNDINTLPGTFLHVLSGIVPSLAQYGSPFSAYQIQHVTIKSAAPFGQATYLLTDGLKFTVGGRYSDETKRGHTEVFDTSVNNPNLSTGEYSSTWKSFTPKVVLSYELVSTLLTYISATKGFESGGYDTNGTTKAALLSAYKPEYVWSYEAGVKLGLFEKRLQLNIAAFDAEYTNLQTRNRDPFTGNIYAGNAAQARNRGEELEATAAPANWITLNIAYSYQDARYERYVLANASGPPTDYSGNLVPFTPHNTLNFGAETRFSAPGGSGTVEVGGDVTYRSAIQMDDANDIPDFIKARTAYHGLLNLHARWISNSGTNELSLWAKNVTDKRSVINWFGESVFYDTPTEHASGDNVSIVNLIDPRMVGVSFTRRF